MGSPTSESPQDLFIRRDAGLKLMEIKRLREKGHKITLLNETRFCASSGSVELDHGVLELRVDFVLLVDLEQQVLRLAAVENSAVARAGGDQDNEVLECAKENVFSGLRGRLSYFKVSFEIDDR